MEIIARKDALAVGLATYYTGKLCKNGHAAYRYVTSGSCSTCINGTPRLPRELSTSPAADIEARQLLATSDRIAREKLALEQRDQRRQLVEKIFICPDAKWMELSAIVIMLTKCRFPALRDVDIVPDKTRIEPVGRANGRYRVNMHADDYAACMSIEDQYHRDIRLADDARIFAGTPGALKAEHIYAAINIRGRAWSGVGENRSKYMEKLKAVYWMIDGRVYKQDDLTQVLEGRLKFAVPVE